MAKKEEDNKDVDDKRNRRSSKKIFGIKMLRGKSRKQSKSVDGTQVHSEYLSSNSNQSSKPYPEVDVECDIDDIKTIRTISNSKISQPRSLDSTVLNDEIKEIDVIEEKSCNKRPLSVFNASSGSSDRANVQHNVCLIYKSSDEPLKNDSEIEPTSSSSPIVRQCAVLKTSGSDEMMLSTRESIINEGEKGADIVIKDDTEIKLNIAEEYKSEDEVSNNMGDSVKIVSGYRNLISENNKYHMEEDVGFLNANTVELNSEERSDSRDDNKLNLGQQSDFIVTVKSNLIEDSDSIVTVKSNLIEEFGSTDLNNLKEGSNLINNSELHSIELSESIDAIPMKLKDRFEYNFEDEQDSKERSESIYADKQESKDRSESISANKQESKDLSESLDADEQESKDRSESLDADEQESKDRSESINIDVIECQTIDTLESSELKRDNESDLQLAFKYKKFGTIRKAINKQSRAHIKHSVNYQESIDISDEPLETTVSKDSKSSKLRKEYILSFLRDEIGFIDCIKAAKEFEANLLFLQKSSKTAVLKSDDWKKFYLDFSTLEVAYIPNHTILVNMMAGINEDIFIGEYFKNLNLAFPIMKNICSACNGAYKIFKKYENNDKTREAINRRLSIKHWSTSLPYEEVIKIITGRFKCYLDYLEKILCFTDNSHFENPELRKILDNCIILWDVLRLVNKDKKAPFHRTLSFITDAVLIQSGKTRVHRYVALFMDVFVIAEENQRSGVIVVRHAYSIKRSQIVQTPEKVMKLVSLPQEKICVIKASIAHNRHLLQKLEFKLKNKSTTKKSKHMKPLIEQDSSLRLQSAQFPLTLEFNKKNRMTILFYQESDFAMWTKIIHSRVNSMYLLDWPIVPADLQKSVDFITDAILNDTEKKGTDNAFMEHNKLTNLLSTSITDLDNKRMSMGSPGLSGVLFCKLLFESKRNDKMDLAVNFETDNYGHFFNKHTSEPVKCGETQTEMIRIYVENTTSFHMTVVKAKTNSEIFSIPVIDLMNEKIHRKPYISFQHDLKVGRLVIYLEFCDDDDICSPAYINKIDHFQGSISSIIHSELSDIPHVLKFCIQALEEYGLDTEGLYRVSGVKSHVLNLKKDWEAGFILSADDLVGKDIHCVAGLLKMFLRDLKERIIPGSCLITFKQINNNDINPENFEAILNSLPEANKKSLKYLMNHLMDIVKLENQNKMSISNLVTVFAPNIFGDEDNPEKTDSATDSVFLVKGASIFKALLINYWKIEGFELM